MRKLVGGVFSVWMLCAPGLAQAQTVGAAMAYHDVVEALGVGPYVTFPLEEVHENLSVNANFVFFFPNGSDFWELNADAIFRIPTETEIQPFLLGGLGLARTAGSVLGVDFSDTDLALNVGGGIVIPAESIVPVVGLKLELSRGESLVLFGGIGFPVG